MFFGRRDKFPQMVAPNLQPALADLERQYLEQDNLSLVRQLLSLRSSILQDSTQSATFMRWGLSLAVKKPLETISLLHISPFMKQVMIIMHEVLEIAQQHHKEAPYAAMSAFLIEALDFNNPHKLKLVLWMSIYSPTTVLVPIHLQYLSKMTTETNLTLDTFTGTMQLPELEFLAQMISLVVANQQFFALQRSVRCLWQKYFDGLLNHTDTRVENRYVIAYILFLARSHPKIVDELLNYLTEELGSQTVYSMLMSENATKFSVFQQGGMNIWIGDIVDLIWCSVEPQIVSDSCLVLYSLMESLARISAGSWSSSLDHGAVRQTLLQKYAVSLASTTPSESLEHLIFPSAKHPNDQTNIVWIAYLASKNDRATAFLDWLCKQQLSWSDFHTQVDRALINSKSRQSLRSLPNAVGYSDAYTERRLALQFTYGVDVNEKSCFKSRSMKVRSGAWRSLILKIDRVYDSPQKYMKHLWDILFMPPVPGYVEDELRIQFFSKCSQMLPLYEMTVMEQFGRKIIESYDLKGPASGKNSVSVQLDIRMLRASSSEGIGRLLKFLFPEEDIPSARLSIVNSHPWIWQVLLNQLPRSIQEFDVMRRTLFCLGLDLLSYWNGKKGLPKQQHEFYLDSTRYFMAIAFKMNLIERQFHISSIFLHAIDCKDIRLIVELAVDLIDKDLRTNPALGHKSANAVVAIYLKNLVTIDIPGLDDLLF
ncbi:hypothetical protein EDD86DRAFT_206723 [Gorgonomyces haynaldii]|nr:hypothetical protein EDD86DRAFT_206723 [Gorgonomyces haynaldii]